MNNISMNSVYPWQKTQWTLLNGAIKQNRLPHALLFAGVSGLGKNHFARLFANTLLCQSNPAEYACGTCTSCRLYHAATHPDFIEIAPEEAGKAIRIDRIRELINTAASSSHMNARRIYLITPAEAMNTAAANALLKILEEPIRSLDIFLLVTAKPQQLLATIRSRTQSVKFTVPDTAVMNAWLKNQGIEEDQFKDLMPIIQVAPLKWMALLQNDELQQGMDLLNALVDLLARNISSLAVAKTWQSTDLDLICEWFSLWLAACVKLKLNALDGNSMASDTYQQLQIISQQYTIEGLFSVSDKISFIKSSIARNINFNKQLLLESLFLCWEKQRSACMITLGETC